MISNEEAVGKFIIVRDVMFSDYMKDIEGNINIYDTYEDAMVTCGMYEFDDVLVLEIKRNYKEPNIDE